MTLDPRKALKLLGYNLELKVALNHCLALLISLAHCSMGRVLGRVVHEAQVRRLQGLLEGSNNASVHWPLLGRGSRGHGPENGERLRSTELRDPLEHQAPFRPALPQPRDVSPVSGCTHPSSPESPQHHSMEWKSTHPTTLIRLITPPPL